MTEFELKVLEVFDGIPKEILMVVAAILVVVVIISVIKKAIKLAVTLLIIALLFWFTGGYIGSVENKLIDYDAQVTEEITEDLKQKILEAKEKLFNEKLGIEEVGIE